MSDDLDNDMSEPSDDSDNDMSEPSFYYEGMVVSRLPKRLKKSLLDEKMVDVHLVGDDKVPVPGFRLALASSSEVFKKMLYGDFAEAKKDQVTIPQSNANLLRGLVEYCISSDLGDSLTEIDEESTDIDSKMEVFQELVSLFALGETYKVRGLEGRIQEVFWELMGKNFGLVCPIFVGMDVKACKRLYKQVLAMIEENPDETLTASEDDSEENLPGISCLTPEKVLELMASKEITKLAKERPLFVFERIDEWYKANESDCEGILETCKIALDCLDFAAIPPLALKETVRKAPFVDQGQIADAFMDQAIFASQFGLDFGAIRTYQEGGQATFLHVLIRGAEVEKANGIYSLRGDGSHLDRQPLYLKGNRSGRSLCVLRLAGNTYLATNNAVWIINSPVGFHGGSWSCRLKEGEKYPTTGWWSNGRGEHTPSKLSCQWFVYKSDENAGAGS